MRLIFLKIKYKFHFEKLVSKTLIPPLILQMSLPLNSTIWPISLCKCKFVDRSSIKG